MQVWSNGYDVSPPRTRCEFDSRYLLLHSFKKRDFYMTPSEAGKLGGLKIREKYRKEYNENPNYCKFCGKKIELTDKLRPGLARQRAYCSKECKNKAQSIKMQNNTTWVGNIEKGNYKPKNKICINCGNKLNKNAKKYCSHKCQNEYHQKEYITKWKNGEVNGLSGEYQINIHVRRYILEKYNHKCSECGWSEINPYTNTLPLGIHHKDGDYANNKEENLQLLCPNCHSLTPTYKNHNKNGKKGRKKYT